MLKKSIRAKVTDLLEKKLAEPDFDHLFLIDLTANEKSGLIRIYIDGDRGVAFSDCQKLSRYLESFLDEDDEVGDRYTLEVSSPGVKRPLVELRQFPQHVGRTLEVSWKDGKSEKLKLIDVGNSELTFETIPGKKKKKKKKVEVRTIKTALDKIEKAVVKISFN